MEIDWMTAGEERLERLERQTRARRARSRCLRARARLCCGGGGGKARMKQAARNTLTTRIKHLHYTARIKTKRGDFASSNDCEALIFMASGSSGVLNQVAASSPNQAAASVLSFSLARIFSILVLIILFLSCTKW
jgi:hypothetical protein